MKSINENVALLPKLARSEKKSLKRTSNPPTTSSALMLCCRICSAILSTCFAGSVLKEGKEQMCYFIYL